MVNWVLCLATLQARGGVWYPARSCELGQLVEDAPSGMRNVVDRPPATNAVFARPWRSVACPGLVAYSVVERV